MEGIHRIEDNKTTKELMEAYDSANKAYLIFSTILRVLTLVGVIISVLLVLQNQYAIRNQIEETRHQGIINQQYIRCIVLLPADVYRGDAQGRAKAVDSCAVQSKLPPKNTTTRSQ